MSLKSYVFCCRNIYKYAAILHTESAYKSISTCFLRTVTNASIGSARHFSHENKAKPDSSVKHIYFGPLTNQIRAVKMFSLSSSVVGVISQPFLYKEIMLSGNIPIIMAAYSFIGFFTVVTPILLHFITKKYVLDL